MARKLNMRYWTRFGNSGLSMNFDALPRFTQGLILLNMALDAPMRMMRRGGIEALFGFLLIPFTVVLLFALPLLGYVLRLAFVLVVASVRAIIGLFSKPATHTEIPPSQPTTIALPASTVPTLPEATCLTGTCTWFYSGGSRPETFPVTRAVMHALGVLTIECDCGTPRKPYLYTINTESGDGINFHGSFRGGLSTRSHSEGHVTGVFESTKNGCTLEGSWEEGGEISKWITQLTSITDITNATNVT